MIDFIISFFSVVFDVLGFSIGLFTFCGGCFFFILTVHDIFCPFGKEYIYLSEEFRKEKKSLRWNRNK